VVVEDVLVELGRVNLRIEAPKRKRKVKQRRRKRTP